jgi:hypothetical protein
LQVLERVACVFHVVSVPIQTVALAKGDSVKCMVNYTV